MRKVLLDDDNQRKLEDLFTQFLEDQGWDGDERIKLMYSFFHTMGMINSNIVVNNENSDITFDSNVADIRSSVLDEAIKEMRSCELDDPKVRKIHLDVVVGKLISLK